MDKLGGEKQKIYFVPQARDVKHTNYSDKSIALFQKLLKLFNGLHDHILRHGKESQVF